MSVLFRLSADFIDKLSNPSYGPLVNEDYALQIGKLMEGPQFVETFRNEIMRIEETEELTSYGWIWLLSWCRKNQIKPTSNLLTLLMRRWSNVFIQALIIDVATFKYEERLPTGDSKRELNDDWLLSRITEVTSIQNQNEEASKSSSEVFNLQAAENLLMALLHLETEVAIAGASYLLNVKWPGQLNLLNSFWARVDLLDDETKKRWMELIKPPTRDNIRQ